MGQSPAQAWPAGPAAATGLQSCWGLCWGSSLPAMPQMARLSLPPSYGCGGKVSSLGLWLRILIRRKCGLEYQSFLQDKLFLTHLALKGF